jgi:hypothetical protein
MSPSLVRILHDLPQIIVLQFDISSNATQALPESLGESIMTVWPSRLKAKNVTTTLMSDSVRRATMDPSFVDYIIFRALTKLATL